MQWQHMRRRNALGYGEGRSGPKPATAFTPWPVQALMRGLRAPRCLLGLWGLWRLWGLMVACLVHGLFPGFAQAQTLDIQRAQRWTLDGTLEVADVRLPDLQLARELTTAQGRRYRIEFDRAALTRVLDEDRGLPVSDRQAPVGLYIERACSDLTVRLNGVLLHRNLRPEFNRFQDCYGPQLVSVPWPVLREGVNELELEVSGWPLAWVSTARRAMGLSDLRLGDFEELKALHRKEKVLSMDLPAIVSGALLLLGLLTLCLMAFAPRQRHLAYFGAVTILWAAINARGWWSLPVDSPVLREGLLVVMVAAVSWAYQRFVLLYADLQVKWLDRFGTGQLALMPLLVAAAGSDRLFSVTTFGNLCAAALVGGSTILFLLHAMETRRRPMKGMAAVFTLGLAMVLLELVVGLGLVEAQATLPLRWGIPLCLVLIGALQMMEFGRQAHLLEGMQRQLEQKIELAKEEIEANFTRLAEDRIEKVTSVERKRIAADLHDDLGAKLLTIVHTSRSDRIAALGREALDEMRLSVRGLTGRPMELSEALADWRTEAMTRLAPTGIELEWPLQLEDLPQVLGARTMVQTTRILREVFNNLIRHSQASNCTVQTQVHTDHLTIEIRDDGVGFEIERLGARQAGLGLLNMQHRARQLQGECLIRSEPGQGSHVRLSLPLQVAAPTS